MRGGLATFPGVGLTIASYHLYLGNYLKLKMIATGVAVIAHDINTMAGTTLLGITDENFFEYATAGYFKMINAAVGPDYSHRFNIGRHEVPIMPINNSFMQETILPLALVFIGY